MAAHDASSAAGPATAGDAFVDERGPAPLPKSTAAWSGLFQRAVGYLAPAVAAACVLLDVPVVGVVAAVLAAALLAAPLALARGAAQRSSMSLGPEAVTGLVAALLVCALAVDLARPMVSPLLLAIAVVEGAVIAGRRLALALPILALSSTAALLSAAPIGQLVAGGCFLLGFGMLGRALFFGTLLAVRVREESRVDAEILRLYDDARLFRLVGRGEADDELQDKKRLVAQTLAVRDGLYRLLRLGVQALDAQGAAPDSAAIYLLDPAGKLLLLQEQVVASVDDEPLAKLSAAAGACGLALKKKQPIRLVDADGPAVQAHRRGAKSVLCVPLKNGSDVRGVLLFDQTAARLFSDDAETLALALAEELVAMLRTEKILEDLDLERQKKERIFAAARAFGGVVRPQDAVATTLDTVLDVLDAGEGLASAAVIEVARDEVAERTALRIAAARGFLAERFGSDVTSGHTAVLSDETWVGRAILQRTALPHVSLDKLAGEAAAERGLWQVGDGHPQALLRPSIGAAGDLRVIPLFSQGEPVAALVVAVQGERLKPSAVEALHVVGDLAGVAFGGALLFAAVERQATTDGLTGLANRRTLDSRLHEAISRTRRNGQPLAVVLTDVDHFKSVNDTYGHKTGDDVLRAVSQALYRSARTSDVVARYGGEEFCLVLEGTDGAGAAILAERMRVAIKGLSFHTDKGPLSVTSSFGVAVLKKSDDAEALLEAADANLYRAKQSGRDRVVV